MRDITLGETFDIKFCTTEPDTGAPATLAGTPVVSAYVGNSTTQITAGITLSVDFDGVTGLHNVRVVATSGNGYAAGTDVALVITTGTVDGNSAVGYVIEQFTIGRSSAFTRLGAPANASVSADVAAVKVDTAAILVDTGTTLDARIPAALVGGRMDASVGAMAAGVMTTAAFAGGAIDSTVLASSAIGNANIANNAFGASKFASDFLTSAKIDSTFGTEVAAAVWAAATRVLTAGTNIALAKGTGVTGFTDLDAAGVRDAVGLASANLDTQLARDDALVRTTIATLASQTELTLTAGSADDDAYNGMAAIITDQSTATQKGVVFVSKATPYVGSTRTVTLESAPVFAIATGDLIAILPAGASATAPAPADLRAVMGKPFDDNSKPYDIST